MIVYLANKSQFREDILSNRIEEIVHEPFQRQLGKSVGASELASWKHSLRQMDSVLEDADIPHNAGVAIEFNIPQTGKRVDFIITGTRADRQRTAVIVELKQWQDAKATTKDAIVSTFVGGREREVNHPSYQAWFYENKLTGTLKKSRISNLFVGSGAFTATPSNTFQGLIVDEAHRLNGPRKFFL
jgi:hypothetical protein